MRHFTSDPSRCVVTAIATLALALGSACSSDSASTLNPGNGGNGGTDSGTSPSNDSGIPMSDSGGGGGNDSATGGGQDSASGGGDGGGTSDGGGGVGTCTSPAHVLPMNPSNPQDGITLSGYYVDTDTWNFAKYPGSQQTMYVCDFNNWYAKVNVNDNANDGAVKTYPNVHMDFNGQSIGSFTNVTSSFAFTPPSSGAWDYAYDIWFNGQGTELMIWTQSSGRQAHVPGIAIVGTVTIDGIGYNVHHSGSYTAYDMSTVMTSGTINVLHVAQDMISRGYLKSTDPLNSIQYGVEVCDTGGVDATFQVNNFSVTAN